MTTWHDYVTWLSDMIKWHDYVTWLCDMTTWHDCVTWLRDMTTWHDYMAMCHDYMTTWHDYMAWLRDMSRWQIKYVVSNLATSSNQFAFERFVYLKFLSDFFALNLVLHRHYFKPRALSENTGGGASFYSSHAIGSFFSDHLLPDTRLTSKKADYRPFMTCKSGVTSHNPVKAIIISKHVFSIQAAKQTLLKLHQQLLLHEHRSLSKPARS